MQVSVALTLSELAEAVREWAEARGIPVPLIKDGAVLAVIRPADPGKAIKRSYELLAERDAGRITEVELELRFGAMLHEQTYTFEGIAAADGKTLLDHNYTPIEGGTLNPGDSFVPYEALKMSVSVEEES